MICSQFKVNILELISPSVDMECILSGLYFDSDVIMKYWLSRNLVSGRTLLGVITNGLGLNLILTMSKLLTIVTVIRYLNLTWCSNQFLN